LRGTYRALSPSVFRKENPAHRTGRYLSSLEVVSKMENSVKLGDHEAIIIFPFHANSAFNNIERLRVLYLTRIRRTSSINRQRRKSILPI
jgi:hypothetical protein